MSRRLPRVYHAAAGTGGGPDARDVEGFLARIELWNGDICDLEVDAIVNAANLIAVDVDGRGRRDQARRRRSIEFAAVRQAPVPLGEAIVTPAGRLAARRRDPRRLARSRPADERRGDRRPPSGARWPAPASIDVRSVAFPALGTGVGGFPLDEAARITVATVRDELRGRPTIEHVIFALRGAAAYAAFEAALAAPVAIDVAAGPSLPVIGVERREIPA